MSSTTRHNAKDLSVAKHLRERRRRETRDGGTAVVSSSAAAAAGARAAAAAARGTTTLFDNRDLLNASQEMSEQALEALRLARGGGGGGASSALAQRRVPTRTPLGQAQQQPSAAVTIPAHKTTTITNHTGGTNNTGGTTLSPPPPREELSSSSSSLPQRHSAETHRNPVRATTTTTTTSVHGTTTTTTTSATLRHENNPSTTTTLDAILPQLGRHHHWKAPSIPAASYWRGGDALYLRGYDDSYPNSSVFWSRTNKEDDSDDNDDTADLVVSTRRVAEADHVVPWRLDLAQPGDLLCFGTAFALSTATSGAAQGRRLYLQVRPKATADRTLAGNDDDLYEFWAGPAPAAWRILPYDPRHLPPVRLTPDTAVRPSRVPVHHGPLVLQHVATGGIVTATGGLVRSAIIGINNNNYYHDNALEGLRQHDIVTPSPVHAVWFHPVTQPLTTPVWWWWQQQNDDDTIAIPPPPPPPPPPTHWTTAQQTQVLRNQVGAALLGCMAALSGWEGNHEGGVVGGPMTRVYDASLRALMADVVRTAQDYQRVRRFVATPGKVKQALGAVLNVLLQEYEQHVVALDKQADMNLSLLVVSLQPLQQAMAVLRHATQVVDSYKGGALLNALRKLRDESYRGHAQGQQILDRLLDAASRPYLVMLQQWLEDGILDDPHGEFMVQAAPQAAAWEDQFVVNPDHVLDGYFSTRPTRNHVLPTGRYWQALRSRPPATWSVTLTYHTNPGQVAAYVQQKYLEASRGLCQLLLVDHDLMGKLQLIKRYFLLDQGDFFVNFMDAAENDLVLARDKLSLGRLQHWLGLSVQLTEHESDEAWVVTAPQKNPQLSAHELRCRLAQYGLMDRLDRLHRDTGGIDTSNPATPQRRIYGSGGDEGQPTGVDIFCIEFPRIPSPLNLILSPKNMNDYQLLFRSLFFAKHVERRLVSVWRDHLALKELPSLRGSMGRTFLLRQRMLHCLQHLIYYMMFEVIEPNWSELVRKITSTSSKEQTVDDILLVHAQFLERTMEACLITNRDLLSKLMRLMRTCLLFADQMNLFMKSVGIHEDRHTLAVEKQKRIQQSLHDYETSRRNHQKGLREALRKDYLDRQERVREYTRRVEREVTLSTYTAMIDRHEEVFNQQLREFMNLLSKSDDLYHTQKVNLCISLDYNGFATLSSKA